MRSRLSEPQKEALRQKLLAVLLEVRSAYLRNGASPLKHWDQIRDRMRVAVRQSGTVEQMLTVLCRSLHLPAPSSSLSSKILALVAEVEAMKCDAQFLQLVEEDEVYLLAEMRAQADDRREQRVRDRAVTINSETGEVTEP
jgi:hypothetical protein